MIKISQFGEGNFLRTFVDVYFNTLNEEGGDYGVYIVKPSSFGSLECLERQNNKYHIVLRGVKDGKATSNFYYIAPTHLFGQRIYCGGDLVQRRKELSRAGRRQGRF